MGTISDKLMRIINTKEDIRQALISKGYDVPTSIPFKEYAKMILDLPCKADSFPDIEGIVARYSASGLTNEQMAANPVWVDKTGNGHDLQMKNLAWGGMSGVGGYKLNWSDSNTWANYIVQGAYGTGEVTDNTIHITNAKTYNALFETKTSLKSVEYKVLIKGLTDDIYLRYGVFNDGKELWTEIKNDGIYTLPSYDYDSGYNMKWKVMSQTYPIDCNITIEHLPLCPGALIFDGVDDYGTCDNFPILTKEKGYTVVALRQWLSFQDIGYPTLVVNSTDRLAAFSFEDFRNKTKSTWNWGKSVGLSDYKIPLLYTYQTSTSYNSKTISAGATEEGSNILQVCRSGFYCANAAIWEIVILDHDATEEELTKIKDYFVKTYPWLFPYQAWTVVGKTNEDEDRATIANITGNGNDLVLSNFGFAEGSGYGLYKLNFNNWFANSGSGNVNIVNVVNPHKIVLEQSQEAVGAFFLGKNVSYSGELKISVSNKPSDIELSFGSSALGKVVLNEGINIVKINPVNTSIGFFTNKAFEAQNIIIEQIPEYEGYLVTDGVDDKITSSAFKMGKDWTVVGDWKFINDESKNAGIIKPSSLYVYNALNGVSIFINSWSIGNNIKENKGFNAICSNGRAYDRNWTEYSELKVEEVTKSNSELTTGAFASYTNYTRMAFKNFAIYPKVLSKDDCIKAYNYLQTLKSK